MTDTYFEMNSGIAKNKHFMKFSGKVVKTWVAYLFLVAANGDKKYIPETLRVAADAKLSFDDVEEALSKLKKAGFLKAGKYWRLGFDNSGATDPESDPNERE